MDSLLRRDPFNMDPTSPSVSKEWSHWKIRFQKFSGAIADISRTINSVCSLIWSQRMFFHYITDAVDINATIAALEKVYNPKKNVFFARHLLNTCRQESDQSIDAYFQKLRSLAQDCEFLAVVKEVHESEAIRSFYIRSPIS